MKKIIYTQEDGSVVVLHKGVNETRTLEELAQKDVPEGCSWRIVEEEQLPQSRNWRNAWTDALPTETVDIDFEKAKEIQKNRIRQARNPLFEKLDLEYILALESGDTSKQASVIAKKQILREFTNNVDSATTLEELDNILPDESILSYYV